MRLRSILFLLILLAGPVSMFAQETEEDTDVELPSVVYGNEEQLRDNILFTIDDCYDEVLTLEMFELLRSYDIQAVFFPLSTQVVKHDQAMWQMIVESGYEIGYHTRDHQEGKTVEELEDDFALFQQEIREVLDNPDYEIHYVRPPYGVWDDNWLTWAEANNLTTVRWNIVTRYDLTMSYFEAVLRHEEGGGIVLMHPRPTDINWLKDNLDDVIALKAPGDIPYRFTNLSSAFVDQEDLEANVNRNSS